MRKLLGVLCLALILMPTEFLYAGIIVSAQNGNWSATTTWTGGVVPGDGDFPIIKHNVVIDQDLGTVAGGGIKTIRQEAGTLSSDGTAHSVYFASTGTNPLGSGTAANPGADATMHGFFIAKGTFNPTNLVITSANDSSPVYIHHKRGDFTGCTTFTANVCNGSAQYSGAVLTLANNDIRHLGYNSAGFEGIYCQLNNYDTSPTEACDIQHNKFTDPYSALYVPTGGDANAVSTMIFSYNSILAPRAQYTVNLQRAIPGTGWKVENNTESGATTAGYFLYSSAGAPGLSVSGNAVLGTASVNRGVYFNNAAAGTGYSITNNLCYSPETGTAPTPKCIAHKAAAGDTTSVIQGNVLVGTLQALAVYSGVHVTENWMEMWGDWSGASQGPMITYGTGQTYTVDYNLFVENKSAGNICNLFYTTTGATNVIKGDHNTCVQTGDSAGLYLGEGTANANGGINSSYFRNSIVTGGLYGIVDGNSNNTWDATEVATYGAGVHHNLTYGQGTAAYQHLGTSTGFDNGTNLHPHASYGDVSADPQFVDTTRRAAGWDTSLGGAGTVANIFTELAKRSGFGGTYNTAYNIADLRTWLFAGFAPKNAVLKTAASDGTFMGAMDVAAPASTMVPRLHSGQWQ